MSEESMNSNKQLVNVKFLSVSIFLPLDFYHLNMSIIFDYMTLYVL